MVGKDEIYKPLFMSDDNWPNNARMNIFHGFDLFAEGYKKAADILANDIIENSRNQDLLVYPIVFLYRQHLELRLKEIIREGNAFLDGTPVYPKNHKLNKLWDQVKEILRKVWLQEDSEEDSKEFDFIDHVIREFCIVDPESDSFRYPENKKWQNPLVNLSDINIRHLAEMMERVYEFLYGVSAAICHYNEMYNEYHNEFY